MRPDAPKDTWCVDRKSQSCQGQSVFAKETAKIQICGVYQIVYQNGKLVLRNYYPETIYFKTWKCFAGTLRRSPLPRPECAPNRCTKDSRPGLRETAALLLLRAVLGKAVWSQDGPTGASRREWNSRGRGGHPNPVSVSLCHGCLSVSY